MGSRKTVLMNIVENELADTAGKVQKGRTERRTLTHTCYHVQNRQWEVATHHREPSPALWDDLEGWGEGREA